MLKLFYITNHPEIAKIVQDAGVDRIFVDMEYIGKEERQPGMDTVKNHHTIDDVKALRTVLDKSELLVRINPIHRASEKEIEEVIDAGADVIMLPMWRSLQEVKTFVKLVNKRAKTLLLLETDEAVKCLDEVLQLDGIDEIHIGLNDLHLSQGKRFLFELLVDGTVDALAEKIKTKGIPFGVGGVGSVGDYSPFPAENVIAEHYRLGSSMVILSRSFCDASKITNLYEFESVFSRNLIHNKAYEKIIEKENDVFFQNIHQQNAEIIQKIIESSSAL